METKNYIIEREVRKEAQNSVFTVGMLYAFALLWKEKSLTDRKKRRQ